MQKYRKGDHVRIAKDLGPFMGHFQADKEAIVIGSYADRYGVGGYRPEQSYTIHIKGGGQVSWYDEDQLTLIEAGRLGLLKEWEDARSAEREMKSDLGWIFDNGSEVLRSAHGATVGALAKCLGCDNLWGSRGEGLTYLTNALEVMATARPFLEAGDKQGWLDMCKMVKP